MANAFQRPREGEPKEVVPGDYLLWQRSDLVADYPPSAYSAEYVARISKGGASEIKVQQSSSLTTAAAYVFSVPSSITDDFKLGLYHWQLEITQTATGNRLVVDTGDFQSLPDMDVNNADPRSHARKMRDAIEAMLEGRADGDQLDAVQQTIGDRSMTRQGLLEMHKYYSRIVAAENVALARKQGKSKAGFVRHSFR